MNDRVLVSIQTAVSYMEHMQRMLADCLMRFPLHGMLRSIIVH